MTSDLVKVSKVSVRAKLPNTEVNGSHFSWRIYPKTSCIHTYIAT